MLDKTIQLVDNTNLEEMKHFKEYSGPFYTPTIIAGILRAYELPPQPELKAPRDKSGKYSLTAYPPKIFTEDIFLKDLLTEWQLRQGFLVDRRVSYLFHNGSASEKYKYFSVIGYYTNPNNVLSSKLWKQNPKLQKTDIATLIKSPLAKVDTLCKFYGKFEFVLSYLKSEAKVFENVAWSIDRITPKKNPIEARTFDDWLDDAYPIVLITDLMSRLTEGAPIKFMHPAQHLANQHRFNCLVSLLKQWKSLPQQKSSLYQELQTHFSKLLPSGHSIKAKLLQPNFEIKSLIGKEIHELPLEVMTSCLISNNVGDHFKILGGEQISEPDEDSKNNPETGFVEPTSVRMNKLTKRDHHESKKIALKRKEEINDFLFNPPSKSFHKKPLNRFFFILVKFLDYYEYLQDSLQTSFSPDQRQFKNTVDKEQEFIYNGLHFYCRIIDHIILQYPKIIDEYKKKLAVSEEESEIYHQSLDGMQKLLLFNESCIVKMIHYASIVINSALIEAHYGFLLTMLGNQIDILKLLAARGETKIDYLQYYFEPLGLMKTKESTAYITDQIQKFTLKFQTCHLKEASVKKIENIRKIGFLKNKYSNIDSNEIFSLADDLASATEINHSVSFCIINGYLRHLAKGIKDQYQQTIKKSNLAENKSLAAAFAAQIAEFIENITTLLRDFPESITANDVEFIDNYNHFIWLEYNVSEILLSAQEIFCIIKLFITDLLSLKDQLLSIAGLQQQQLQLLKIERSILVFLQRRDLQYIVKWCYLENDCLKTIDVNQINQDEKSIKRVKEKVTLKVTAFDRVDLLRGFKIESILSIQRKLTDFISGNRKIHLLKFPQPTEYEKIFAEAETHYRELLASENKLHEEEKKKNPLPQRPKHTKIKAKTPLKLSKISEKPEVKAEASMDPVRAKFNSIQKEFKALVEKMADAEISQRLTPLYEKCNDLELKVEMNNLLADYFLITAQKMSHANLLNPDLIDRLYIALSYKHDANTLFKNSLNNEFIQEQGTFFEDNIACIEAILAQIVRRCDQELEKIEIRLHELKINKLRIKEKMGNRWYSNPHPKYEREELEIKRDELLQFEEQISDTRSFYQSVYPNAQKAIKPAVNHHQRKDLQPTPKLEIKLKSPQGIAEEKINKDVELFAAAIKSLIKSRMDFHGISMAPDNYFPQVIIRSTLKFMSIISQFVKDCKIYTVGGLISNLFQNRSLVESESEFNFPDVGLVTNVRRDMLIQIAKNNKWNYRISGVAFGSTAFKLRFENLNFDINCIDDFNFFHDRESRDLNINGIYVGLHKDQQPFFIDNNNIMSRMIDTQLLGLSQFGLIKACTGHLKNIPITQVLPQWKQLCQLLSTLKIDPPLVASDYQDMEHTIKCFIRDPVRMLRIAFKIRSKLIKLSDLDHANRLFFNNSTENCLMSAIIEQYVLSKNSLVNYAIIFDKYVKYTIKKASRSLDCTAKFNEESRHILFSHLSKMMQWFFSHKYFLRIFMLPLTLKIQDQEFLEQIEKSGQLLFSEKQLLKNLIELYTSEDNLNISLKLLPMVLALVITVKGGLPGEGKLTQLIAEIAAVAKKIPGLNQLYANLSAKKIPSSIENHLTLITRSIYKNSDPLPIEQKSGCHFHDLKLSAPTVSMSSGSSSSEISLPASTAVKPGNSFAFMPPQKSKENDRVLLFTTYTQD